MVPGYEEGCCHNQLIISSLTFSLEKKWLSPARRADQEGVFLDYICFLPRHGPRAFSRVMWLAFLLCLLTHLIREKCKDPSLEAGLSLIQCSLFSIACTTIIQTTCNGPQPTMGLCPHKPRLKLSHVIGLCL